MKISENLLMIVIGTLVVSVAGWYVLNKSSEVISEGLDAINPANNDNIINQGAIDLYQKVTGSTGTIGTDLYDWLHPEVTAYPPSIVGRPGFDPFLTYNGKDDKPVTIIKGEWRGSKL